MGWFRIPWWVYGLVAVAPAVVWAFVWPGAMWMGMEGTSLVRASLMRWGFALSFLLFALDFFVTRAGFPAEKGWPKAGRGPLWPHFYGCWSPVLCRSHPATGRVCV